MLLFNFTMWLGRPIKQHGIKQLLFSIQKKTHYNLNK